VKIIKDMTLMDMSERYTIVAHPDGVPGVTLGKISDWNLECCGYAARQEV